MFEKAPPHIIALVKEVIEDYHPRLHSSNVAVVMRDVATRKNGVQVLGTAERFPDKFKPFTNINFDFLITLAMDTWAELDSGQRRALVDHELCHLEYDENLNPTLRAHDVEEFVEVFERHGFWKPELRLMANAVQTRFEFTEEEGVVGSLEL